MPIEHDRLIDAAPVSVQEEQLEKALRPRRLADYVGQRKIRQQLDIFSNPDTWIMTLMYVMTFGVFSGFSAQFALIINTSYGKDSAFKGMEGLPAGATYAFLGPLVGAGSGAPCGPWSRASAWPSR